MATLAGAGFPLAPPALAEATEIGRKYDIPIAYDPIADQKSWNEMAGFLKKIFHK